MANLPLTRGMVASIDDEDCMLVSPFKWRYMSDGYAMGYVQGKNVLLHNFLLGFKGVDHIDGDKLNNRRSNLRAATVSQNGANRKAPKGKAYKGITRHKSGKWQVIVKRKYVGLFETEQEAAHAYDLSAVEMFGVFAKTNKDLGLI